MVYLRVGEQLQLKLGDGYIWTINFSEPGIIKALPVTEPAGQMLFDALQPGRTELQAMGDPKCRLVKPPCGMPSILFTLQIVVE